jgi:hypothetical protein
MLAVQIIAGTNDQVNIQIWLEMKQDLDRSMLGDYRAGQG